jgi:hypothetical protein
MQLRDGRQKHNLSLPTNPHPYRSVAIPSQRSATPPSASKSNKGGKGGKDADEGADVNPTDTRLPDDADVQASVTARLLQTLLQTRSKPQPQLQAGCGRARGRELRV